MALVRRGAARAPEFVVTARLTIAAVLIFGAVIALAGWQPRPTCEPPFVWLPGHDVLRLDLVKPFRTFTVDPGGSVLFEVQCDEIASARRFAWRY